MTGSRMAHRAGLAADRDVLHALAVTLLACVLSLGLVYVAYVVRVLRVARRAPCAPVRSDCLLLFGKHAPGGHVDADFQARLDRLLTLWRARPPGLIVLLGGGPPGEPGEAELAYRALREAGLPADAPVRLEAQSRDTFQNLRNARQLLCEAGHDGPVSLLSSRYHLARCLLLARQLGFDGEPCAAEPAWRWTPAALWRIAGEAGYVCWIDIGTRWARLTGNRRMLARMT